MELIRTLFSGKEKYPTYLFSWAHLWRNSISHVFQWFYLFLWLGRVQTDPPNWCECEGGYRLAFVSWFSISFVLWFWFLLWLFDYFQNLYWADSGDLVAIASDTSFYILKYNVRILVVPLRSWWLSVVFPKQYESEAFFSLHHCFLVFVYAWINALP